MQCRIYIFRTYMFILTYRSRFGGCGVTRSFMYAFCQIYRQHLSCCATLLFLLNPDSPLHYCVPPAERVLCWDQGSFFVFFFLFLWFIFYFGDCTSLAASNKMCLWRFLLVYCTWFAVWTYAYMYVWISMYVLCIYLRNQSHLAFGF